MTSPFPMARPRHLLPLLVVVFALLAGCAGPAVGEPSPTQLAVASPTQAPTEAVTPSPEPPTAAPTDAPVPPTPTLAPTPTLVPTPWLPWGSPLPPTLLPDPTPLPAPPTEAPTDGLGGQVPTGNSRPTRIVVPSLGIDMPVIKGDANFPLCNVAQYMTNFVHPGQAGTTYLYGHARTGMFLPLLTHSRVNDGNGMLGLRVLLYTADEKLHVYKINIVARHVRDFDLAYDLEPGQHRLIMQTSEGPSGLYPKLQVAARPIGVYRATAAEALPTPHPKVCG